MMFGAGLAPNPFILRSARVRAFVPLLAALENQNLLALLCETAAGDGSAETAADDNDIEIHGLNLRSPRPVVRKNSVRPQFIHVTMLRRLARILLILKSGGVFENHSL